MESNDDILHKDLSDIHLNIDRGALSIIYQQYKSFLLPVAIIIICVLLFFVFVIPQIQNLLNTKDQESIEQQKLGKLKENYNILVSMDQATLDSSFQTMTSALPSNKDFVGIINSISFNSIKSGVVIGDFQFSIGNVSKPADDTSFFPSTQITLNISGSPLAILDFISLLSKSTPLTEVTSLAQSGNSATIIVQFYYKAFPQGELSNESTIKPLIASDTTLVEKIASWDNASFFLPSVPTLENSTESGSLNNASSSAENNTNPF